MQCVTSFKEGQLSLNIFSDFHFYTYDYSRYLPFFLFPLIRFAPLVVSPGCDKNERVGGAGLKQDIFHRYPLSFPNCV